MDEDFEIVVMELEGPSRVLGVKTLDGLGDPGRDSRMSASVAGQLALQRLDRIGLVLGVVKPTLDGRGAKANRELGRRRALPAQAETPTADR